MVLFDGVKLRRGVKDKGGVMLHLSVVQELRQEALERKTSLSDNTFTKMDASRQLGFKALQWGILHCVPSRRPQKNEPIPLTAVGDVSVKEVANTELLRSFVIILDKE